ncbi:MAG: hypothetical protein WAO55_12780 [Candidatus Manganitrophaceae bacterium]
MGYFLSILIFLLSSSGPAFGQADYRNLDPGRPITIEDAQPIEFRAFEFQFGPRYRLHQDEGDELSFEPELKWGFAKDWQAGLSAEEALLDDGETTDAMRHLQIHLLYNLNQEDLDLPAIAFRPELTFGAGDLGSDHPHGALKVIVSKTFGFNRVHLNGSYTIGPTEAPGKGGDFVKRYLYGIAYERTAPIEFFVLLFDLYAAAPIDGSRREIIYDLGTRIQITPTWVFDAGFSHAIRSEAFDFGVTIGLSYVFSPRWIFPKGL